MDNLNLKVSIRFEELSALVKQLSYSEKLKLSDVIWDEDMNIPKEHQELVSQRIRKAKQNPERMVDWAKASKLLKS